MSTFTGPQFLPNTNSTPGTPITAANIDALVVAQSFRMSGGIPAVPGSGLVLTQPVAAAVVNNGTTAVYVAPAATTVTATASKDNYIDLDNTGAYHKSVVANGAGAPAVFANSIRLYMAVANATDVTAVIDLSNVYAAITPVHKVATAALVADIAFTVNTSFTTVPSSGSTGAFSATWTGTAGATALVNLVGFLVASGTIPVSPYLYWQATFTLPDSSTVVVPLHCSGTVGTSVANLPIAVSGIYTLPQSGTYSVSVQAETSSGSFTLTCAANSTPILAGLTLAVTEAT